MKQSDQVHQAAPGTSTAPKKERPILFQGDMVRALLAGTKTQTRRALPGNLQPLDGYAPLVAEARNDKWIWMAYADRPTYRFALGSAFRCPYGMPGDKLWVREAHWFFKDERDPVTGYFPPKPDLSDVIFRADGEVPGKVWRPSIHMPRWASRITLEVTGVRVQRLWDISDADVQAEGCEGTKLSYAKLWESINGKGSWDANPWVWVVSFRRVLNKLPESA